MRRGLLVVDSAGDNNKARVVMVDKFDKFEPVIPRLASFWLIPLAEN